MDGDRVYDLLLKQNEMLFSSINEVKEGISRLEAKTLLYSNQTTMLEGRMVKMEAWKENHLAQKLQYYDDRHRELAGMVTVLGNVKKILYAALALGVVMLIMTGLDLTIFKR